MRREPIVVIATMIAAALLAAGEAAAAPKPATPAPSPATPRCADIALSTRMCANPGHTAIVTSPNPAFTNPFPGWGFGTLGTPGVLGRPAFGF